MAQRSDLPKPEDEYRVRQGLFKSTTRVRPPKKQSGQDLDQSWSVLQLEIRLNGQISSTPDQHIPIELNLNEVTPHGVINYATCHLDHKGELTFQQLDYFNPGVDQWTRFDRSYGFLGCFRAEIKTILHQAPKDHGIAEYLLTHPGVKQLLS